MASPTWYFDGDKRRIYEVPPSSTFTIDGNGYRIYNGGSNQLILTTDVKKDLYSRWVDWVQFNDWSLPAFSPSGGALRPTGENASVDFSLLTSNGWRIVLANYSHETIFYGNFFAEGSDSLFDISRMTVVAIPRLQGSANLLSYKYQAEGTGITDQELARMSAIIMETNYDA